MLYFDGFVCVGNVNWFFLYDIDMNDIERVKVYMWGRGSVFDIMWIRKYGVK